MTVPWWQGRLVAFDIETTGVDVEEARIVTATVAAVGGGEPSEVRTLIADPGVPIPEEAAKVHGYTTERAREEGRPARDVILALDAMLGSFPEDMPMISFNARFDFTILDREFRRHGIKPWPPFPVIDPFVLDKHLDPYRKGSRRLEAVCAHYRCKLDGAHDSAHDALAAARVAYRIGQTTPLGDMSAAELHNAQIAWAAHQAQSLRDYFRRKGDTKAADSVRDEWPVHL